MQAHAVDHPGCAVAGAPFLPELAADSPLRRTATRLAQDIAAGRSSAQALAGLCLERSRACEPVLHAFRGIAPEPVLAQARAIDASLAEGTVPGPLCGLPVGVKDIIDAQGWVTGMGSPIHDGQRPAADSVLVARLRAAGAIVFAKTVTSEFAFMHPRETRNPWNPAHTPGGSSSGSAAAVAAGCVPLALGTQTNGSVIRPAAFCGVVGFKPSLGALSTTGVLSYAPTLDQPGCHARSVAGVALLASAIVERGFSIEAPVRGEAPPRLLAVRTPVWPRLAPAAATAFERVLAQLAAAGATVEPGVLPAEFDDALEVHATLMGFEAARWFGPLREAHRAQLSPWLDRYLEQAAGIPESRYREALAAREWLREAFGRFLAAHDALVTPPAPGEAPAGLDTTGDPSFCTIWTLLGAPAVTLPCGVGPGGLPLGLQVVASECDDDRALASAAWIERALALPRA
jgi:Asp-tRNA(Asn)/Glu-tRNA(Gln) amidotransferase A subunit family amidase